MTAHTQSSSVMLKRLRIKFIIVNMALATLVLAVAFTTICVLDYRNSLEEVQVSLENAITHSLDDAQRSYQNGGLGATEGGKGQQGHAFENEGDDAFVPPQIGGRFGQEHGDVPVASYHVNADGIYQMMGKSSASVSDAVLGDAVQQVLDSSQSQGYLSSCDLYFAKAEATDGFYIAFADGSAAAGWRGLAWGLTGVGLVALAILFVFNLLFSRWALRPVQRAWQQQRQFIADASHELKTPLTVILANSAILQREGDKTVASQGQWIESTKLEAERMQGLVTDMLELARSDAGDEGKSERHEMAVVPFSRLVEGEVLGFESVAFDRGIFWTSEVESGIAVKGEARRLQRLVAALLDNACKYTPSGAGVSVSLKAEESMACLRVNNAGDPIALEDLAHVFDRFYRADKARTHHDGEEGPNGYGLGLSIAQQIAVEHKGSLEGESNAEEGTTFTLKLPLA